MNNLMQYQLLSYQQNCQTPLQTLLLNKLMERNLQQLQAPANPFLRPNFSTPLIGSANPALLKLGHSVAPIKPEPIFQTIQVQRGGVFGTPVDPRTQGAELSLLLNSLASQLRQRSPTFEQIKLENCSPDLGSLPLKEILSQQSKEEYQSTEKDDSDQDDTRSNATEDRNTEKVKGGKKIKKQRNACGHTDRKHYAKGLCHLCYHKRMRNQKPKNCEHDKLYAKDLCQKCYTLKYRNKKNQAETTN